MPRIARTIIPRIRKSLRERGLVASLCRGYLLPVHLLREYRAARSLRRGQKQSCFDQAHGVDTEGDIGGWTYLSDLEIASPNWIHGVNYTAIEPERFNQVLASIKTAFDGYTFVDFGSGKGRALLLASEFPFKRIIGVEFAPELHAIATENIRRYQSPTQKCSDIESVNIDFTNFELPAGPLVLFFYHPCRLPVFAKVVAHIGRSLAAHPRPMRVAYVAPPDEVEELFAQAGFLKQVVRDVAMGFVVYACVL